MFNLINMTGQGWTLVDGERQQRLSEQAVNTAFSKAITCRLYALKPISVREELDQETEFRKITAQIKKRRKALIKEAREKGGNGNTAQR
jgi:lambda repressor-like predicted transcriptional regulator